MIYIESSTVSKDCPFCGCETIRISYDGEIGYAQCTYCEANSPIVDLDEDRRIFFEDFENNKIIPFVSLNDYIEYKTKQLNLISYQISEEDIKHFIIAAWCYRCNEDVYLVSSDGTEIE